jgi:hypothetical protein
MFGTDKSPKMFAKLLNGEKAEFGSITWCYEQVVVTSHGELDIHCEEVNDAVIIIKDHCKLICGNNNVIKAGKFCKIICGENCIIVCDDAKCEYGTGSVIIEKKRNYD